MIKLLTGIPGSSKTLHTIKLLNEDPLYQNRPVYYYNVKDVTFENWIELTEEEVLKWYELPVGAVIFIDECQKVFRSRSAKDKVPQHTVELETHRHNGHDLICTTQHPMLLDTSFRRQVGEHWHIERKFGFESARVLKWQECQNDPKDYHCRQEAITETHQFPKQYYGTYKSAEVHTVKKQIPKKLYLVAASIIAFLALGGHFAWKMMNKSEMAAQTASANSDASAGLVEGIRRLAPAAIQKEDNGFKPVYPLDPKEYLALFKPRLDGQPNTAPIYDHLMQPTVAPQQHCLIIHRDSGVDECRCYTQQATKINISAAKCKSIVEAGLFDNVKQVVSTTYNADGQKLSQKLL